MPYIALPQIFGLMFDIDSLEALHLHLTGERPVRTGMPHQTLLRMMQDHEIPFPPNVPMPEALNNASLTAASAAT